MKAKDIEVPVVKRIHKLFDVCYYLALSFDTFNMFSVIIVSARYSLAASVAD